MRKSLMHTKQIQQILRGSSANYWSSGVARLGLPRGPEGRSPNTKG